MKITVIGSHAKHGKDRLTGHDRHRKTIIDILEEKRTEKEA